MNEKELNSNGNTVLTKDAKMFKKLEKENAKLKAELESEKRLTKQIDKHLFDKEKELLAEEKAELSLAELARIKMWNYKVIIPQRDCDMWIIRLFKIGSDRYKDVLSETYADASQKCFEHLRRIK